MVDVMIDIETLGTRPGCCILSIAAVPFSLTAPLESFYERISIDSCIAAGLTVDDNTVAWWKKQDPVAMEEAFSGTAPIAEVLQRLNDYLATLGTVRVWGNGASFDVPLLEAALSACSMKPKWSYTNSLCYRTLKNLFPFLRQPAPTMKHNALADAKAQAVHAEKLLKIITGRSA